MITAEFLVHTRLEAKVLETWVESGWLLPRRDDTWVFSEIDAARVQLIRDLKQDLGVNDEGVAVILDLVDQIHGLRRTLRGVAAAISAQPEPLQQQIAAAALRSGPEETTDK